MAELSCYKTEPVLGKPLEWWNKHEHSYTNLSLKYLGVVAMSVPSERLFSCAGNVITSFLHDNLPSLKDHLPNEQAK